MHAQCHTYHSGVVHAHPGIQLHVCATHGWGDGFNATSPRCQPPGLYIHFTYLMVDAVSVSDLVSRPFTVDIIEVMSNVGHSPSSSFGGIYKDPP